jgi:hypothetical protein
MNNESKDIVKNLIKQVFLKEFYNGSSGWDSNNDITLFHGYPSGVQKFPYVTTDLPENLKDVNDEKDYLSFFNKISANKDVYTFPFEDFKTGLEFEISKENKNNKLINTFELAQKVLKNLSINPQHYSTTTLKKDEDNSKNNK